MSGCVSLLASLLSLSAFSFYARWHWDLFRIRQTGTNPPPWLNGDVIDGLKLASVILAITALIFAGATLNEKRWLLGMIALILALLCAITIPIIT